MIGTRTERKARDWAWVSGLLVAALLAAMMLTAKPAHATTYIVNSTDDAGDQSRGNGVCDTEPFPVRTEPKCTLRAAIQDANAAAGADTITVPAGTYTLTINPSIDNSEFSGDLDITDDLTITGAGARTTRVAGGTQFGDRIFENSAGATTTISGLTITGGETSQGGGVRNRDILTLDRVAVKDNTGESVGGIYSFQGTLNLTDSTVAGNAASDILFARAGGISQYEGTANITNSTISGNQSASNGSGVAAERGARMNILNSTIASNTSGLSRGGIASEGSGTAVFVKNTIVAGNTQENCSTQAGGIIFSQGNSLSSDGSCGFTQSTDKQNTDPWLGPLQDNGGPTDTRALLAGSPAIDAASGDCLLGFSLDQRGVERPQGPRCDIGAYERLNSPPVARNDAYRGVEDRILRVPARGVLRNDTDADGDTLTASRVSGPGKGRLTLRPNGAFTYKPPKNFNGAVRFVYRASDGRGGTDTATVTIRIKARPG